MPSQLSDHAFDKGLRAVSRGDYLEGLAYFEASIDLSQKSGETPAVRSLSYYGLCLAMASRRVREALDICERAVAAEFYNPELYLNLGRVYLRCGDRRSAFGAFVQGLRLNHRHGGIIAQIRRLGFRRRPVVGFLRRGHPLNRLLGRVRSSLERDASRGRAIAAA